MANTGSLITLVVMIMIVGIAGMLLGFWDFPSTPATQSAPEIPFDWTPVYIVVVVIFVVIFLLSGLRIVRQTHRAVVETFGKYKRFQKSGITWIIPVIQQLYALNVTETLVDVKRQDVITKDNLNATVDAQVYYKIGTDEKDLKNAFYNVDDVVEQIVQLAKSTLRDVIGQKPFREVNSDRTKLNKSIFDTLTEQTQNWGIKIVRVELKEIEPPKEVQETMNSIIKAENKRDEAMDLAKANKIEASGDKLARIERAEGFKREQVLRAEGEAKAIKEVADGNKYEIEQIAKADAERIEKIAKATAEQIKLVNRSANEHFIENAKDLKTLEVTEQSLKNNSKIILTEKGISPQLIIDTAVDGQERKIVPLLPADRRTKKSKERETNPESKEKIVSD